MIVVMKKIPLIVLLLVNVVFAKDILLLHSYHQGYGWSDSITKAVIDNFTNSDIDITIEYMDTKNIYTKKYEESLFRFYREKYKNRTFDLIIASDNNALNFLENYNQTLFPKTPIIFCGINNFDMKKFQDNSIFSRSTGVIESVDIKKNIELILKLHPKLSKLLVINDTTTTGLEIQKEFVKILPKYQNRLDIEYIDKFDITNLKQKVKNLPKNSAILFMLLFKDETGKVFTFKEGLESIKHSSSVPIYGLWDFYIKYGLVGGYLTHGYEQGKYASLLAKEYFKKHNISKIKPILQSPNRYIFEYEELKRFNIDINSLV